MKSLALVAVMTIASTGHGSEARAGAEVARVTLTVGGHELVLHVEEGDHKSVVKTAGFELEGHADAKGLHLTLRTPGPDFFIDVDSHHLRVWFRALFDVDIKTIERHGEKIHECVNLPGLGDCCIDIAYTGPELGIAFALKPARPTTPFLQNRPRVCRQGPTLREGQSNALPRPLRVVLNPTRVRSRTDCRDRAFFDAAARPYDRSEGQAPCGLIAVSSLRRQTEKSQDQTKKTREVGLHRNNMKDRRHAD